MIEWIDVRTRVPDDRRDVLAWGYMPGRIFGHQPAKTAFIGVTRFNPSPGGGRWDCENPRAYYFGAPLVTHWAEIGGPPTETQEGGSAMKVWLVEDCANAPGRILAVLANEEDARAFVEALPDDATYEERTLFYGQPSIPGYNE